MLRSLLHIFSSKLLELSWVGSFKFCFKFVFWTWSASLISLTVWQGRILLLHSWNKIYAYHAEQLNIIIYQCSKQHFEILWRQHWYIIFPLLWRYVDPPLGWIFQRYRQMIQSNNHHNNIKIKVNLLVVWSLSTIKKNLCTSLTPWVKFSTDHLPLLC